ncbi:hypothetical protein [Rubrivivax gelatinosus]|uniref:hypothetical protein n=1 Tax=Rubrivivax gelatinosus TaxID=28068 RepID=UPI00190607FA|nr:hypothetical protein [Rubrivivax gelatinosus]
MKPPRRSLPPFPVPIAAALGHYMVRFQELEVAVLLAIGRYLHAGADGTPPPLTMAVLSQLSYRSLVAIFEQIPTHLKAPSGPFPQLAEDNEITRDIIKQFKEVAKLCSKVEARRNQLMHSNWLRLLLKEGDESIIRAKIKPNGDAMEPESVSTIEHSIRDIDETQTALAFAIANLNTLQSP